MTLYPNSFLYNIEKVKVGREIDRLHEQLKILPFKYHHSACKLAYLQGHLDSLSDIMFWKKIEDEECQ